MKIKSLVGMTLLTMFVIVSIQSTAQDKKKQGDVHVLVDEMPEYPGGDLALRKDIGQAIKYPPEAKQKGIQGKVYITFVVDKDGKITDPTVARSVDPLLDKEALRVMDRLKIWTPGKEDGEAVKVAYTVPINFVLKGDSKKQFKIDENGDKVYFLVDDAPDFPGGDAALRKYISESVKYPEDAKKNGIQGKVYVTFTVNEEGKVVNSKIARGVDPALNKESLRVMNSSPKWSPGKQDGKAVKVSYTVPINFVLD